MKTRAPGSEADVDADVDEAADDDVERRETIVPAGLHRARLDKALVAAAPEFSRSHLQSLVEAGHVRLDGQVERSSSRRVSAGQRLTVLLVPTDESRAFRAEPMALARVWPRLGGLLEMHSYQCQPCNVLFTEVVTGPGAIAERVTVLHREEFHALQ